MTVGAGTDYDPVRMATHSPLLGELGATAQSTGNVWELGLNAENSRGFSSRGETFLLTFPSIELSGRASKSFGDPNENAHPVVNGHSAHAHSA